MNNPNEKLKSALKKFFEAKVAEINSKYHLDHTVVFSLGELEYHKSYYFCVDEKGAYLSNDYVWAARGNARLQNAYFECSAENISSVCCYQWHDRFYASYKNIVKELDDAQKRQDDLYKAVERFERNTQNPPSEFSLQA